MSFWFLHVYFLSLGSSFVSFVFALFFGEGAVFCRERSGVVGSVCSFCSLFFCGIILAGRFFAACPVRPVVFLNSPEKTRKIPVTTNKKHQTPSYIVFVVFFPCF